MTRRCDRPGCSEAGAVAYGFDAVRRLVWLDAPFDDDRARSGALCLRHAGRLTAPRGWWLDDRRIDVPELFHQPAPDTAPLDAVSADADPVAAPAPKRRRRRKPPADGAPGTPAPTSASSAVALAEPVVGTLTESTADLAGGTWAEPPLPANLVPFPFDADEPAVVAEGIVVVEEVMVVEDDDDVVGGEVVLEGAVVVEDDASPLNPMLEPSTPLLARAFSGTARTDRPHHRPRRSGPAGGEPDATR